MTVKMEQGMDSLLIRGMIRRDIEQLSGGFLAQGWHKPPEQYERYLREQESGVRQMFVAEAEGRAAGYLTLVPTAKAGPFAGKLPEIMDFNVLKCFQRRGIGTRLMDAVEAAAARLGPVVCIGVGLHSGYGTAQRMYVRRGYIPDGSGVWYRDRLLPEDAPCRNDDDLVLYLSKKLS